MISTRLLSTVMNVNCTYIDKLLGIDQGFQTNNKDFTHVINIHELAHKCKLHFHDDYIFDEACYDIKVTKIEAFTEPKVVYEECWMDIPYDINQLFKACEWILENR